ncbi:MAG: hypothetical protein ABSD98_07760 [Candidatus Korobacteraceae bacterium]|jgi:hypothetical protein
MATGLEMRLTKQVGEHLVAAELGRLGYIATPFAGNVPMFDLLVADKYGRSMPVQVKAINGLVPGAAWQFNLDKFLKIEILRGRQYVRGRVRLVNPHLVCVFVLLSGRGKDRFFVFPISALQRHFTIVLGKSFRRPKNPEAKHCAIAPVDLERHRYEDNWGIIQQALRASSARAKTRATGRKRALV